ncbi:MAG: hypothetical protein AAFX54_01355 [Pseudomonadota bacterium]
MSLIRGRYGKPRIVLIYGLFGPPIGGFIVYIFILGSVFTNDYWWSDIQEYPLQEYPLEYILGLMAVFVGIPLTGYVFGGVHALLTGTLVKYMSNQDGHFGYFTAFWAAFLVGITVGLVLSVGYLLSAGAAPVEAFAILALIGVASSLTVRFLFRRTFSLAESL